MTVNLISKASVPWRQLAMASIREPENGNHATVIAHRLMQE
jgi:hypothetical protein